MSLKKAIVQFTKPTGEAVTRVKHVKKVVIHYDELTPDFQLPIETIYEDYASEEAQAKGAIPEISSQKVTADLTVQENRESLETGSDLIWNLNRQTASIMDYSETDGDGKMFGTMKSLDDLGAVIEEVN
jgi:hypothetical protein